MFWRFEMNVEHIKNAMYYDNVFKSEFENESDRASVILAVSMLDEVLTSLLKIRLVHSATASDPLFDNANSPLSTFSCKIDFAYRIGLISNKMCRDIHIIRKIRNEFAHNISGCNYENQSVRNRILELKRSMQFNERFPKKRKEYPEGLRGDLQIIISWLIFSLWVLVGTTESINEAELDNTYILDCTEESIEKSQVDDGTMN